MPIGEQAPYAPSAAVIRVLETYRDTGLGGRAITADIVSKLSVGDSIAPRVIQTLRALDLIDDDGQPTDDLLAFKQASSDSYRSVLSEILLAAYEPVFAITGRVLESKTASQIEDAFRSYRPDSLRKRMVTLFTGLCTYAGLMSAPPPSANKPGPKPRSDAPRAGATLTVTRKTKANRSPAPPAIPTQPNGVIFGVSEDDIAALSDDEFDTVWSALGTVARARARAKVASQPSQNSEDADDDKE